MSDIADALDVQSYEAGGAAEVSPIFTRDLEQAVRLKRSITGRWEIGGARSISFPPAGWRSPN